MKYVVFGAALLAATAANAAIYVSEEAGYALYVRDDGYLFETDGVTVPCTLDGWKTGQKASKIKCGKKVMTIQLKSRHVIILDGYELGRMPGLE